MSSALIDAAISRWRAAIPEELWAPAVWLLWKRRPKPGKAGKYDKLPYCVDGRMRSGACGSPEDRARLVDLGDALATYQRGGYSGIGLALLADVPYWALDLDGCIDGGAHLSALAQRVVESGSYTERSPSGTGVRALFAAKCGTDGKNHTAGVETFDARGFVTITGDAIGADAIVPCPSALLAQILATVRAGSRRSGPPEVARAPPENPALAKTVRLPRGLWRRVLNPYRAGCDRSAVAFGIAASLARAGLTREQALEVMAATPCMEPAAERRGGDIASAREWLWRYVVSPAFERGIADGR